MAGMGPPPKPAGTRQRRNATHATTRLPAAGRSGSAPAWPLPPDVSALALIEVLEAKVESLRDQLNECQARSRARIERDLDVALSKATVLRAQVDQQVEIEGQLWDELWCTPQSVAWEQLGWMRDVAQYVRHKVRGEAGSLDDAKEARQWSDRLGLNPLAMLRLRWETEKVNEAEDRGRRRRATPGRAPVKKTPASADPRNRVLKAVK